MAKAVYEVVPARAASQFRGLPTIVRDLLKLCDGTRTLDAICARSPLPVERTEQIVGRLVTLGIIRAREPKKARRGPMAATTVAWVEGALPVVVATPEPAPAPIAVEAPPIAVEAAPIAVEAPPPQETPMVAVETPMVMEAPIAELTAFTAEEESFFSSSIDHLVADEYAD